ncbi:MAG: hypothetical protein ACYCWC_12595 [Rhodocyclaceae bacterium]
MAERIAAGVPLDAGMLAWIVCSFKRYMAGDGSSLEACFLLNGTQRVMTRNRELRAAAELLRAGRELSMWNLAGLLAERIRRFKTTKLILYRRGLPVQLDDIDMHLLAANQSGARSLDGQRRLFDLLYL